MFRTIKWYLKFIFSLIIRATKIKKADKLLALGKEQEYNDFVLNLVSTWAKGRIKDSGATVNVHGLENLPKDKGILFVSNHQSNFDIILLLAHIPLPKGFIAKIELNKFPFINKWMTRINCLFMDRNDIKQSAKIIIEGINQLKSGINMVVFPEGTRSKTGKLGEFKSGSFKLAVKANKPIVPLTICGTMDIMEANNYVIKPSTVNLYIHPPIYTLELTKEEITTLPSKVKTIIEKDLTYSK